MTTRDDGGAHRLLQEIATLKAEVDVLRGTQRMCVNCGKTKPASEPRQEPLPECVGPDGFSACTFDMTPQEAIDHWRVEAHRLRADLARTQQERDQKRAEVEMLRGVGCNEDGDGPCGVCLKCARAERDALAQQVEALRQERDTAWARARKSWEEEHLREALVIADTTAANLHAVIRDRDDTILAIRAVVSDYGERGSSTGQMFEDLLADVRAALTAPADPTGGQ